MSNARTTSHGPLASLTFHSVESTAGAEPPLETGVMTDLAGKAWVVSVDMGYGHQRAAYPLRHLAYERILTANSDKVVEPREQRQWRRSRAFYEGISRVSGLPLVGPPLWRTFDRLQHIGPLFPHRDLSRPTWSVRYLDWLVGRGLGRSVVEYAGSHPLPFLTTFFVPALAAVRHGLDKVFCIVTDTDVNRVWVARDPARSPIVYLVPTDRCRLRLLQYGVPPNHIHLTGFPLPEENVGPARRDLRARLSRLDPKGVFFARYRETILRETGPLDPAAPPLTITYSVGGAGAQREVAAALLRSLGPQLREGRYRLNLNAGTRMEVRNYFLETLKELALGDLLDRSIRVLFAHDKKSHFEQFNEWLRDTDILWTKPSELVFYTALGLPIVMTDPLGAHEEKNREWLQHLGSGFTQEDPQYAAEWLSHWIDSGMLAEAAFHGYTKAPRHGTENIRRLVFADNPAQVELRP